MIYFTLPQSPPNVFRHININSQQTCPLVFISQSLCNYMNDIKNKIYHREKDWDVYKKYTNPYEYIHSIVPQKKKSISKYKPISRSYFKMLEMISVFKLDHSPVKLPSSVSLENHPIPERRMSIGIVQQPHANNSTFLEKPMRTFHLAEGPGGFIEAICNKRANPEDEYYGMTIIIDENDDNVPAWHKTGHFLSQHPNVILEYGKDNTGNLLNIENFEHCVKRYGGSMDLVTADGGFDFSKDFNRQEISITNLLWGQVCYAICLQKPGGNFVLKIFDIFYEHTVHILYFLSGMYEEVNVCKLKTSRIGNSEKYVVCRKFRGIAFSEVYPFILESFSKIKHQNGTPGFDNFRFSFDIGASNDNIYKSWISSDSFRYRVGPKIDIFAKEPNSAEICESYIWQILDCDIPRHFTKHIEDVNAIFGQQQIENIHYTISLIDKQPKQDKLDQLVKQNITKCMNWCVEHSIAYNNFVTANLFEQGQGNQGSLRNPPSIGSKI